ncbi:MAG: biotin--[acetyl-CoA-carboxylase] ligase [Bacteroidales bacterium]
MKIIEIEELASTNKYLQELINGGEDCEGVCVRTQFQTDGRGQIGNGWESEKGKNLTFSFVLHPEFLHPVDQYVLSQTVSVAIKHVLDDYANEITIKWPNDIYWRDKKIAGILIENSLSGVQIDYSVIGVGLNVNQETFVSNAPNPISLKTVAFKPVDIELLFSELLSSVLKYYIILSQRGATKIRAEYMKSLYRREGFHPYSDLEGRFNARIVEVSNDGCLHLLTDDGEARAYYFKEVVFEH